MDRVILHSDMNSYYASVEMMLNPELRGKAMAVGGNTENRNGIILAKSEKAKKAGVKTGMALWETREVCPDIIIVPPHYEEYIKYSKLARNIYARYTDRVESFGMNKKRIVAAAALIGAASEIAAILYSISVRGTTVLGGEYFVLPLFLMGAYVVIEVIDAAEKNEKDKKRRKRIELSEGGKTDVPKR